MFSITMTLFALVAVGIATVTAYGEEDLPDCVCKSSWKHNEYKCNSTIFGEVKAAMFNGCPKLSELSKCEYEPEQSWCETTETRCKQQSGESVSDGWVYCDAETQEPQLPFCTCKASWAHKEFNCKNMKGGMKMSGCPTIEEIAKCEPDTDIVLGQSWCETEQDFCLEQVDWEDKNEQNNETHMMGHGWAYCDSDSGETELPNCDCGEEGSTDWAPWAAECESGASPTFSGCPTTAEYEKSCGSTADDDGTDQPWCKTLQSRCKQQSSSTAYSGQVDEGWAYCSPETGIGVLPTCECMDNWLHNEAKCAGSLQLEMAGCPTIGKIGICEFHAQNSWCDTTYDMCEEQGSKNKGEAWAFCDAATQEAELPPCECKASWTDDSGDGETDLCTAMNAAHFRGCPTLEEIQRCDPATTLSWCDTTQLTCRDQEGEAFGDGWAYCNPETQEALPAKGGVGKAVGVTFVLTVMFCVALFIGFLLGYRRYLNRHKRGYSQDLLESSE